MNLDLAQEKAADIFAGPALILAGPGSGKTTVMTCRIHRLTDKYHVPPENILAVTFSRAAAFEMYRRYTCLMHEGNPESSRQFLAHLPSFGTFHSIFYHMLLTSSPRSYSIIPDAHRYGFFKSQLMDMNVEYEDERETIRNIAGYISRFKNSCTLPKSRPYYEKIRQNYDRYLSECGFIDFDDMLLKCCSMLSKDKVLLQKWQNRYQFILIDEFQDINELQYKTIRLLAGEKENIFAVGDDDQSIYRFRGAEPGIMNKFLSDYPSACKISLSRNYRSGKNILNAAAKVIRQNSDRVKHDYSKASDSVGISGKASVHRFGSYKEEIEAVSHEIRHTCIKDSRTSIAVLFRRNIDMVPFARKMHELGISFNSAGKVNTINNDPIFNDICAYLSLANDTHRDSAFQHLNRILNKPARYISPEALRSAANDLKWSEDAGELLKYARAYYRDSPAASEQLKMLNSHISALKGLTSFAAVQYILKVIGYENFLKEKYSSSAEDRQHAEAIVHSILERAQKYTDPEKFIKAEENENIPSESRIHLLTMHASKGLEFDIVYLPGVNESIIPGRHTCSEELNEECRLLYVAMTRAAKELHISYCDVIRGKHDICSRYISSLLTSSASRP